MLGLSRGHPHPGEAVFPQQLQEVFRIVKIWSSHSENNYTHLCFIRKRSPRDFFSILLVAQC